MALNLYDSLQNKLDGVRYYGHYFSCYCPFHNNKNTPAFMVYAESDNPSMEFHCLSCGRHGTLAYLDKYLGSTYSRSLTQSQKRNIVLPRWSRWEAEHGDLEGIARHAHEMLKRYKQFQKYFERRKINEWIDDGYFGYLDGWATFPVYSPEHKLVDIVVRAISGKGETRYVVSPAHRDGLRPLYSPDWKKVQEAQTVYVPFGLLDSWSFHALGLACVTGITGKSIPAEQLKPLGKRFVIVPDYEEEQEAYRLANKLGWKSKVQKLEYDDCKDPDEIRRKFGNQYLLNLLGA